LTVAALVNAHRDPDIVLRRNAITCSKTGKNRQNTNVAGLPGGQTPPHRSPPEGGNDLMLKSALIASGLAFAMTTGANALTINNKSAQEISIGLDQGDKETVHKIAAGKSVTFKTECDDHCGVTGPWNFSWWAKTGDTIDTDGKSLTSAKEDAS
jgi:hypothetical protein